MKFLILFAIIAASQAFIFDDLFGKTCHADADCAKSDGSPGGCCVLSSSGRGHCHTHRLRYLEKCHLSGKETNNCGCDAGLYCETYENIGGVAVEHNPTLIYGLCEHGTANGTVAPPGVAVEGGR